MHKEIWIGNVIVAPCSSKVNITGTEFLLQTAGCAKKYTVIVFVYPVNYQYVFSKLPTYTVNQTYSIHIFNAKIFHRFPL